MSQGFGPKFDAAQCAYDYRVPEEEPEPVENECQYCHEIFEADGPQKYCDACQRKIAIGEIEL